MKYLSFKEFVKKDGLRNEATTNVTSRERPKSALYLRLKNSKRNSKSQVFSSTVPEKPKVGPNWRAKRGGTLWKFFTSIVAKHQKLKGDPLGKFFFHEKSLTKPKKLKGGPLVSPGIVCYAEKGA